MALAEAITATTVAANSRPIREMLRVLIVRIQIVDALTIGSINLGAPIVRALRIRELRFTLRLF